MEDGERMNQAKSAPPIIKIDALGRELVKAKDHAVVGSTEENPPVKKADGSYDEEEHFHETSNILNEDGTKS